MISCKSRTQSSMSNALSLVSQPDEQHRYDFEYEDDDDQDTADVGVENKYYNAKQMKVDNPSEAIEEFLGLPALEEEKGDWYGLIVLIDTVESHKVAGVSRDSSKQSSSNSSWVNMIKYAEAYDFLRSAYICRLSSTTVNC